MECRDWVLGAEIDSILHRALAGLPLLAQFQTDFRRANFRIYLKKSCDVSS